MVKRKIVKIDEEKCDGCGLCVPSCAEGAIQIIDGKARLVSDTYCDGLGACLGECPQDAISIVEREAEAFDEEAARRHVEGLVQVKRPAGHSGGCPGAAVQSSSLPVHSGRAPVHEEVSDGEPSALGHWPVQLHLVPPTAPFLKNADLLLVADCVPFALADFHKRFLQGRPVVIGCPKLDDAEAYVEKLAAIAKESAPRGITVIHVEVPCCTGLVRVARQAMELSGCDIPVEEVTVSIRGTVL
jgi:Pyruvate/2-oxoacid:ferredoxin oxidoreductase delta subunit